MIICKDNSLIEEHLTIGKKYKPLGYISANGRIQDSSIVSKSDRFVYVTCDDGKQRNYSEIRFTTLGI